MLESAIENGCRDIAHAAGWTSRKMNGLGFNSWPDRLFIAPQKKKLCLGNLFWVEFKRPGEVPTPAQERMIKELRARGQIVYVIDNKDDFKRVFKKHSRKL